MAQWNGTQIAFILAFIEKVFLYDGCAEIIQSLWLALPITELIQIIIIGGVSIFA